jgi:hypothetical protein
LVIWSFRPFLIRLLDKASGDGSKDPHLVTWKGGKPDRVAPCRVRWREQDQRMRTMFGIWLTLLVSGIVLYTIIGLSHH